MFFKAKPFVKWAGGKSFLLSQIDSWLPHSFLDAEDITYVEPFVGGGAMLFFLLQRYPAIHKVVINDINEDLIECYHLIKKDPKQLIMLLERIEKDYNCLNDEGKKEYYYYIRNRYNDKKERAHLRAAYFFFLNRTCFNGLYRVNGNSQFNVPFGKAFSPVICNKDLIMADHNVFNSVDMTILCGSYKKVINYVEDFTKTFFYIDPPYLPISVTSYFKQYSNSPFGVEEQVELKLFCDTLSEKGSRIMLSNSDCKREDGSSYFESLYPEYDCHRVRAKRIISAHGDRNAYTSEVLIKNY